MIEGFSESSLVSLAGWDCLRRAHFWTPKSGRKRRWGDPRPPILFNRLGVICGPDAAEFPIVPRNRCGGLRTSPAGPRAEGGFCFPFGRALGLGGVPNFLFRKIFRAGRPCRFSFQSETLFPQPQAVRYRKQIRFSLQKAVRRSPMRNPPQVGCPEDSLIQWQRSIKSYPDRSDKTGSGGTPAAFWLLCRRGQSNPRRGVEYP